MIDCSGCADWVRLIRVGNGAFWTINGEKTTYIIVYVKTDEPIPLGKFEEIIEKYPDDRAVFIHFSAKDTVQSLRDKTNKVIDKLVKE